MRPRLSRWLRFIRPAVRAARLSLSTDFETTRPGWNSSSRSTGSTRRRWTLRMTGATRTNDEHGRDVGAHLYLPDADSCDATAQLLARWMPAGEWIAHKVSSPGAVDAASGRCGVPDAEGRRDSLDQCGRRVRRRHSIRHRSEPEAAHASGYDRLKEKEIRRSLHEAERIALLYAAANTGRRTKLPHAQRASRSRGCTARSA